MFEVVLISEKTGVQGCMRSYIGKCTQNPLKPPGASQRRSLTSYNLVALPDSGWVEKKSGLGIPVTLKPRYLLRRNFLHSQVTMVRNGLFQPCFVKPGDSPA